jgi:Ca2+-binding EF-hand superfamily protein
MYDTDKDGKISGAELDKCGAFKAAIKQIDTNGDGAITAEEITNRVKAWQSSKIGQMPVRCMILHNGSTLSNAEVQFVPEKFLGESIKVAKGKTDASGMTAISIQSTEPNSSGVAPGLYRVEITKAGEKIPAKYNTETILGQEVASDAPGLRTVLQFNLKY